MHKEAVMLTLTRSQNEPRPTELVGPRSALVRQLTEAYWQEVETTISYAASSTNRDGIDGAPIGRAVREAITSDLEHAQQVALRIRQLHAPAPSPNDFARRQLSLRPPADPLDKLTLLTGLIEAETAAIERYRRIAALASEARDWITVNLTDQVIREKETNLQRLRSFMTNE
jgi:bacterioferritin